MLKCTKESLPLKYTSTHNNNNNELHYRFGLEYFGLEPREIVDAEFVLASRDSDKDVEALQYFHLLEPTTTDHRVHCHTHTHTPI